MKKISAAVLATLIGGLMVLPSPASAGPPTPIGVAEGKRAAKKYVHNFCASHNCRGSRVRNCESKTQYRVDCDGVYGRGAKDVCTFKISVLAVKDRQLRITIRNVRCKNG
jgi:hypothetical protein